MVGQRKLNALAFTKGYAKNTFIAADGNQRIFNKKPRVFRSVLSTNSQPKHPTGKLFFLGVAFGFGLVYASLIPLRYEPVSWSEAVEQFRNLRWLNLDVYRRADWVANGLAVMPFGFLLAGAADHKRAGFYRYILQMLAIMACGMVLVVLIEFTQLWFPPRTVSGNDIAAGCVGAIVGPMLWPLIGRPFLKQWNRLTSIPKDELLSPKNARILFIIYATALVAYSIMPLDVMLNTEEWRIKYEKGRFAWVPNTLITSGESLTGWLELASGLALSSIRMFPLGMLAYRAKLTKSALILLITFPVLLELLQAPIFTRYTVFIDILCGWIGGLLGLVLAANWSSVRRLNQSNRVRIILVLAYVLVIELAFTTRYERVCTAAEIATKWESFWAPPFSKYYYTTEFLAASNFAGKAMAFAVLGFLVGNLYHNQETLTKKRTYWKGSLYLGLIFLVAACIEIPQVYLQPFIADASDILIYITGAAVGWQIHNFATIHPNANTVV